MFLWWLYRRIFRRGVTRDDVKKILEKENFIFTEEDISSVLAGNKKGTRFGAEIIDRNEDGNKVKRYLKVVLSNKYKDWIPFRRQALFLHALASDADHKIKTIYPVSNFFYFPVPYVVLEARDVGDNTYGFMEDTKSSYSGWTEEEMYKLSSEILQFHQAGLSVGKEVLTKTQILAADDKKYKEGIRKDLHKQIEHRTKNGEIIYGTALDLIERYTGVNNFEEKALEKFEEVWKIVEESLVDSWYLVHADTQLDNVYKRKDGDFELFDFEWVGKTHSPLIAIMRDYGNLRSRGWFSNDFQKLLDEQFFRAGQKILGNSSWVEAGMLLGRLVSSIGRGKDYLDYQKNVVGYRFTEERYHAMYFAEIAALKEILS